MSPFLYFFRMLLDRLVLISQVKRVKKGVQWVRHHTPMSAHTYMHIIPLYTPVDRLRTASSPPSVPFIFLHTSYSHFM